ncbi:phage tail length tape measure family protein [Microvirga sp. Mcv34]|uniref:phage tail length tape measure family protein n=1 Tax=Microvirga sp. Mcv34 TaxID=2926016 RepID=UPI0021C7FBCD|nr:phage tail length tape measure family protein [Microvirga sp. Mcv34]
MAEAVDMQRLVVSMEARFTTFNKELQKLTGSVEKETKKIGDRFKSVNDNLQGQTANLAAQFQDIGVQLASGTSPLTVALQQGTQISAVLGETKGGAAGAVKALGSAFASVVSPISLATIGIIALGGAAIQYVAGMVSDTQTLDDRLKIHADLIKQIKDAYGEAAEGLEDYAKQSTAVLEVQTRASILKLQEDLTKLSKTLSRSLMQSPTLLPTNPTAGIMDVDTSTVDQAVPKYQAFADAIRKLQDEAKNGEPNIRAFQAAISAIANANQSDKEIQKLAGELLAMSQQAYDVENALTTARRAIGLIGDVAAGQVGSVKELKNALSDLARIGLPTTGEFRAEEAYKRALENARTPGERAQADNAYLEAQQRLRDREAEEAAEKARREAERKSEQAARRAESDAERKREAYAQEITDIQNATRALELEFEMRGKSNVEREKARQIMQIENALQREGVTLSGGQRATVEQLAESYAQMSEKLKEANATQQELQQLASSTLKGFVSDLMDGVSAADALQNALKRVGDRLLDLALDSALKGILGGAGGGGNIFSSLLGGLTGQRAMGGPVQSGGTYLVGENGPELVQFGRNGTVIPNHALPRGGSGGGMQVVINNNAGAEVQTRQTNGPQGPRLEVQLEQALSGMISSGRLDKSLKGRFGVSPMGGR